MPSILTRVAALIFALECGYLLVPWQALVYGYFDFGGTDNYLTWAGAPLAYLMARAAWCGQRANTGVVMLASWIWLLCALVLNHDPHGMGPRSWLLITYVGWLPAVNLVLWTFFVLPSGGVRSPHAGPDSPRRSLLADARRG